ncbi:MAG: hypothetical protein JXA20_19100 [Spirochaetes bacterium]|nr:hypothetical protein [Spirochaetota bacterium]
MGRSAARNSKVTPLMILLSCISLLLLNYNPDITFLSSFLSFMMIALLLRTAFKNRWRDMAGLRLSAIDAALALSAAIVMTTIIYRYISWSISIHGVVFQNRFEMGNQQLYLFTVFQTLNEEIIAGALLLFCLRSRLPRLHPLLISWAAALLFAAAHGIVYRFVFHEHSIIGLPALLALFAVGIIRNNAILACDHIGFSWAIHLSWNLVFFGGRYRHGGSGNELTEAELFNTVMGNISFIVTALCVSALASIALWWILRKSQARKPSPVTDRVLQRATGEMHGD